jgi:hypothetical protein
MKTLKSILHVWLFMSLVAHVNAQSSLSATSGLYSTLDDFTQQKLTYQIDCRTSQGKVKTHDLFGSSTGYVSYQGKTYSFDKNKVYGYRSCEEKNYRFYNNSIYQIIDTAGFYVYYQYQSVEQTKGKGLVKTDLYFFSKKGNSELFLLTTNNLKEAFPENTKFHYALDAHFANQNDLMAYDKYEKVYKLKYLFFQSLK